MEIEAKHRILVVDDETMNLKILKRILSPEYDVVIASCGPQALEMAVSHQPDLILLDVVMPNMNGIEVCEQLKADASLAQIPIIFISALDDHSDEKLGLEAGASDYITKPIKKSIVLARIKIHLQNRLYEEFLELLLSSKGQALESLKAEAQRLRHSF